MGEARLVNTPSVELPAELLGQCDRSLDGGRLPRLLLRFQPLLGLEEVDDDVRDDSPATGAVGDPRTLARAARDHVATARAFAVETGLVALDWIAQGYGYEITTADVWAAYLPAKEAADRLGAGAELRARVRAIIAAYTRGENFVRHALSGQLVDA
jgi:hypothetical protein